MRAVLEIGGTHVTAALVDPLRTRVSRRVRRPLDAWGNAEHILGTVVRCAGELQVPAGQVWGAAVPGPFDHEKGIARFKGVGKFEDLYGIDVRSVLIDGVRPRPADVVFLNDAHAFTLGEWCAGAAAGHRRCVGITLGSGVGSAFLADGVVRRAGPGVPPEGRVDLLRWSGAPLEHSVSRRAILARYGSRRGSRHGGHDVDVRDIAVRAREGEKWAGQVLDEALAALGTVIAPYVRDFGASAVVVGGAMALSWDLVGPAIGAGLGDTPVRPRPGTLGADAALIGAAVYVDADGRRAVRRSPGRGHT
ncbi:ROK family protein [Streptomyces sp. NPDC056486]|uniref:ROK family protein n=1 Tax=Streptomyces sp. NPDC056486 TaxID=3345835 RepID=UPI0036CA7F1E